MALNKPWRNSIDAEVSATVGEEEISERLSYFPARDVEEAVTSEHLDRRVAEQHVWQVLWSRFVA